MDYLPVNRALLKQWAQNFRNYIRGIATRIKEPEDGIAKAEANMDKLVADISNAEQAHQEWQRLVAVVHTTLKSFNKETRDYVKRIKTNPLYREDDGKTLQIISTTPIADLTDYKPVLVIKETGGYLHLSFKKHGADGMNIYWRLAGETTWKLLVNAKHSPYIDARPLANAGVPEEREYYIMPTLANTEVGQRSDMVSVKFKG